MQGAERIGLAGWIATVCVAVILANRTDAQQTLTFNDDFQSGSYWSIDHNANDANSTTDDLITIEPVRWSVISPENAGSSNPPLTVSNDHWWWAVEAGNLGGLTPTFRVNTSQAWFGSYGSSYSPVYRYVDAMGNPAPGSDGWQFFDTTTQAGTTFSFSNNTAFDASLGDVQISYGLPYTPEMSAAHTQGLATHPRVSPTVTGLFPQSGPQQFGFIGQTPTGHTDLIRTHRPGSTGTVTVDQSYDLLGYRITDPFVDDAGKQQVVLMSGNHASEHQANIALQGMVDFLTSGHPVAELLLDRAEFHVYPIVDPEGRALGQTRGNDSASGFGLTPTFVDTGTGSEHIRIIDHNRVWDRTGSAQPYEEVDLIRDALLRDTSANPEAPNPTTDIDYFFDFHGFPAGGGGDNTPFEVFESGENAVFISALQTLTGMTNSDIINGANGSHPGIAERWAFLQGGELDAEHAFTPEIGVAHQTAALPTPQHVEQLYLDHGEDYARALAAVLLPANTVVYNEASPRNWNSASWATLTQLANSAPNSTSHALVAATTGAGSFAGPSSNTTVNALTVFGYSDLPTRGTPQPLKFYLQPAANLTVSGTLHIENAHVGPTTPGGAMGNLSAGNVLLIGYERAAILDINSSLSTARVDLLGSGAQLRLTGGSHDIDLINSEAGHLFLGATASTEALMLDSDSTLTHAGQGTLTASNTATLAGTLSFVDDDSANLGDTTILITADAIQGSFDGVTSALFASETLGWSLDYFVDTPTNDQLIATVRYAGDATGDNFVGVQDLDLLLTNWGDTVAAGVFDLGDFTGDGVVNEADLQLTLANWSLGTPPGNNIPEPGTLALLALSGLFRSHRKHRI